jgi:hypothetical protein
LNGSGLNVAAVYALTYIADFTAINAPVTVTAIAATPDVSPLDVIPQVSAIVTEVTVSEIDATPTVSTKDIPFTITPATGN